jgi:hypothetical protein
VDGGKKPGPTATAPFIRIDKRGIITVFEMQLELLSKESACNGELNIMCQCAL